MKTITGLPDEVISDVVEAAEDIVEDRYMKKFSIGRTSNIESKRSELGADDVVPVYTTENSDNAIDVEETLIDIFHLDPSYAVEVDNGSSSGLSEGIQFVYIAVWLTE